MQHQSIALKISDNLAPVSAEIINGKQTDAVITLAHGAGAGMNHIFMTSLAYALAELNVSTLRFNFYYMEQKKKRPDLPATAHKAVEAALLYARQSFPKLPLFASGKSFGGRMTSQYLAEHPQEFVKGIVFFGFPLHPPGKPSKDRAEHLKKLTLPTLFLQGSRDELAQWTLIEEVVGELPRAALVKFDGADHAFKAGKQNLIPLIAQQTKAWIDQMR